jgi:hypothetical protein
MYRYVNKVVSNNITCLKTMKYNMRLLLVFYI